MQHDNKIDVLLKGRVSEVTYIRPYVKSSGTWKSGQSLCGQSTCSDGAITAVMLRWIAGAMRWCADHSRAKLRHCELGAWSHAERPAWRNFH